jgi:hypothetical protein
MGRWTAVLLALLVVGAVAAQAAARSPASLVPAQVTTYQELNLAQWRLGGKGDRSLEEVFEQSGLLPGQRAIVSGQLIPGPLDSLKDALNLMWEALQYVGPRIGWVMTPAPQSEAPGAPVFLGVAEVKDAKGFSGSVDRILRGNSMEYREEARDDGVRVLWITEGPAVVIGPDWAALCSRPALVDVVTRLAAAKGEGSLAADARYQRAMRGLPPDALITQYASPAMYALLTDLVTAESRPAPGVPPPAWPDDGIAWALRASADSQEGRRMLSLTWTIDGDAASSAATAAIFGLLSPVFDRAREAARKRGCLDNMKELSRAMSRYVAKRGRFPRADRWRTELAGYVRDPGVFRCSDDRSGAECSYAMNSALSGKPRSAVRNAARQVVLYETAHPGNCPRGGRSDLPSPPRHLGGQHFGFADGHAKWVPEHATQLPVVDW